MQVAITYVGRVITVIVGLFGMGIIALNTATLERSLRLSKGERNVLRMLANAAQHRHRRHLAAVIVCNAWLYCK